MRYYRNYGAKNINLAPIDDLVKVLPTHEQTGKIVTFDSPFAGLPLKSHIIALTATQSGSGTPSPDNVRAISGFDSVVITRCGKNLINLSDVSNSGYIYNKAPIFLKSGTYVFSVDISARGGQTFVLRKDNTEYFRLDFTANIGRNVIIFTISDEVNNISLYSGVSATFTDFQIEKGDTVSEFEAYNGNTYTFPFGQTVYGGEYDARTGLLTVTHGFVDLGTLNWGYSGSVFYSSVIPTLNAPTNNIICSSYETVPYNIPSANMPDKSIKCYGGVENKIIYIKDSDYTDTAVFKTAMSGVQLVYELATPTTIQLPPCPIETLQGENNIWADTGDTTAEYYTL